MVFVKSEKTLKQQVIPQLIHGLQLGGSRGSRFLGCPSGVASQVLKSVESYKQMLGYVTAGLCGVDVVMLWYPLLSSIHPGLTLRPADIGWWCDQNVETTRATWWLRKSTRGTMALKSVKVKMTPRNSPTASNLLASPFSHSGDKLSENSLASHRVRYDIAKTCHDRVFANQSPHCSWLKPCTSWG